MISDESLSITVDGQVFALNLVPDEPLLRAAIVSLFTWRRANDDDELPGGELMGWWGDTYADIAGDRIGSRLWLLARETLTPETLRRAREYATEALQWMLDDGVATAVAVTVQRSGLLSLGIHCLITRADTGQVVDLRFSDVWKFITNAN